MTNEQFFTNLLHKAQSKVAKQRLGKDAKRPSTVFVEPSSDQWIAHHRTWKPEGYYRLHCSHDRPLWEPCASATCRRDSAEAKANLLKFLSGELK